MSFYFSTHDNMVYAIDLNNEHIEEDNSSENIKIFNGDAEEILKNNTLLTKVDVVYMLFFHSMPYDKSERVFKHAYNNLKQNGLICIEVRSDNDIELKNMSTYDETDKSYKTTHKRWLYKKDTLEELQHKMIVIVKFYFVKKETFRNVTTVKLRLNPLLLRMVFKKLILPHLKKVKITINTNIYYQK